MRTFIYSQEVSSTGGLDLKLVLEMGAVLWDQTLNLWVCNNFW